MKRPVKIVLLVAVVALLGWSLLAVLGGSTYQLEARFTELPADDAALADWLGGRPGVRRPSVARDGKTVRVEYELGQGQPRPDVLAACDHLGYRGLTGFTTRIRTKPLLGFN